MIRTCILSSLLLAFTPCVLFSQIGRNIDTAGQREKIERMPTDTTGLQKEKFQNSKQGGEHSDRNTEMKRPPEGRKDRPQSQGERNKGSEQAVLYHCKKCGQKSEKAGLCAKDGGEMVKSGFYYCPDHNGSIQDTEGKCPKCGKKLKRMSRGAS